MSESEDIQSPVLRFSLPLFLHYLVNQLPDEEIVIWCSIDTTKRLLVLKPANTIKGMGENV